MTDLGGQGSLNKIKGGLVCLRDDLRQQKFLEGVMISEIFRHKSSMTEKGKNYLYDDLDEELAVAEFTEDDLKD